MRFWLVDTFSDHVFGGNPAGVIFMLEFLDDVTLTKIAAEVKQVETAFIKPLEKHSYHLRWFAPTREVKLCGHATLAAAHILWEEGIESSDELAFTTLSGILKVKRSAIGLTMDFPLQPIGEVLDPAQFEEMLSSRPLAAVKVGDDILVELAGPEFVRALEFDGSKLLAFDCRALIVTSRGDQGYDMVSRLFAPRIGIAEDAVSAASHCKLADYWQKKTGRRSFRAYQASKRGGEIFVEIVGERVYLTGKAVTVVRGEFC